MIAILRTILTVTITANAVIFGAGALFGLSPQQSVGAEIIMVIVLATIAAWRWVLRVTNQPRRYSRQEWTHPPARLPEPYNPIIRIETPAPLQIEAPQATKELCP